MIALCLCLPLQLALPAARADTLGPAGIEALLAGPHDDLRAARRQDVDDEQVVEEAEEVERLEAWPTPDKDQRAQLKKDLGRLRKANTPEMGAAGHAGLLELGDLAGLELLKALSKERKQDARERIVAVLDAATDLRHTRLLAAEFGHKSEHVRLWSMRRAAAFPDAGIRAAAEAAYAAAEKRVDTKKEVKHELYAAALALSSSGSIEGLGVLHARALEDWGDTRDEIRAAIEALRGPEATARMAKELAKGDRKATVGALRLLAGCGDLESGKALVKPHLDSTDNSIRVAAINAARGIVDGEPELAKLSVFEAVELANKWKARL